MEEKTKGIYNVTVAVYATMAVEATSPQEAMEIAKKYKDEYITEEDFENSGIEVEFCESYPSDIDDYEDGVNIFTADGVMKAEDYADMLDENAG